MADSLVTKITLRVQATDIKDLELPDDIAAKLNYTHTIDLASGTGADQADLIFRDQRTISGSSNEDLDLAGTLTDVFGATITFARIKAIIIVSAAANGGTLTVGGASSNGLVNWVSDASDKVVVRPGGMLVLVAKDATAYAVTAGTGDLLNVANTDGSAATYDVIIIGASA